MRKVLIPVIAVAGLALASLGAAATVAVTIRDNGFSPNSVTITVDDRVTWTNRGTRNHQVVADNGAFASPTLRPGQTYSFTFRASGTYRYRNALDPVRRGTVVVRGAPPSVSLGATESIVVFGNQTHVQGVVSSRQAGEPVTVMAQPYGQASYAQLATVTTTTGGNFDLIVSASILTNYQAQYKSATSQPISVQVRPKISLMPGRRGWFLTRVTASRSFAGRRVYLQRRNTFGQWVSIRQFTLGQLSGRLFRIPATSGTYRIFMTVNQAGEGYLEAWSGTQPVRR